ncbi:MAG TPA: hypothetical protein ENN69_08230, partial [Spirochaetia bacterium]|nr:hypothetical protein [Spirochaetia bacterium]
TKLIDTLICINLYPDIRIWSIRSAAYAAACRAPLSSSFGAAHAAANGKIFGIGAALACRSFLTTLKTAVRGSTPEAVIDDFCTRKVFFSGFGRPLVEGEDERFLKLSALLEEWRYPLGETVRLLRTVIPLVKQRKNLNPNYASLLVSLMTDPPFSFDEERLTVLVHFLISLSSYTAACDVITNGASVPLLPLRTDDVRYTGKPQRTL